MSMTMTISHAILGKCATVRCKMIATTISQLSSEDDH